MIEQQVLNNKKKVSTQSLISSKDILQKWMSIKMFSDKQKLKELNINTQIYTKRNDFKKNSLG